MDEAKQTDSIRLSRITKKRILTEVCLILYPEVDYYPFHSIILNDMVKYIISRKDYIYINPLILKKVMNDCILEFIKYNPDNNIQDIKFEDILTRIIAHYLRSDPI